MQMLPDNHCRNITRRHGGMLSRMRGQALILALVSMVVLVLGVIVLFNTGQVLDKKVELVNAADATAYSVAVQQARAYNAIAYMNRASVANEVAIAQAVSWYSWTNYALSATDNMRTAAAAFAGAALLIGAVPVSAALIDSVIVLSRVKTVLRKTRDSIQPALGLFVDALAASNYAFARASAGISTAAAVGAPMRALEVVRLNTDDKGRIGPVGIVLLGEGVKSAAGYTKRYEIPDQGERSADADRYANVVMEARDGFSRKRSDSVLVVDKRGGTDLVDYRRWVGADTLNAKFSVKLDSFNIPFAWGGGAAQSGLQRSYQVAAKPGFNGGKGWVSPFDSSRGRHKRYDKGIDNGKAGKNVLKNPAVGGQRFAWLPSKIKSNKEINVGLMPYMDTVDNRATVPYLNGSNATANGVKTLDVGPVFTVLVEQPINTVRTSSQIKGLGGEGEFYAPDRAVGDTITAMASAQVYFSRPRDLFASVVDSRREVGNLFSPYWQARLVETPCSVRQRVAVFSGAIAPCIPGRD